MNLNALIRGFTFGLESLIGGDAIRVINRSKSFIAGNGFSESESIGKSGRDFGVQPPGYGILFASMKLVLGSPDSITFLFFTSVGSSLFVILIFLLGNKLKDLNFAILSAIFASISVVPFVILSESNSFSFTLGRMYPDLAGTNTDTIFIYTFFLFLVKYLRTFQTGEDKYLICMFVILFAYGISHISRFLAFQITIIILFMFLSIYLRYRNEYYNSLKSTNLIVLSIISTSLIYFYYYYSLFLKRRFLRR